LRQDCRTVLGIPMDMLYTLAIVAGIFVLWFWVLPKLGFKG
jgi:hypothetical protein